MRPFYHFGRYLLLMRGMFFRPENIGLYWKETLRQMIDVGYTSIPIVLIIAVFLGAVTTVQSAYQLVSDLIPKSVIGAVVVDSTILELAPTVTCLVLAGKVGSSISSELGTMRISEQIDALEIMGVNTPAYLVLPKVIAALVTIPMLIILAAFFCIYAGLLAGSLSGILSPEEFITGARDTFKPYTLLLFILKSFTFAFIISSVSAYHGYYTSGGALEVGRAGTRSVVYCCILILCADYLLAEMLL